MCGQFQRQKLRHLLHYQPRLLEGVGGVEHLSGDNASVLWPIGLDVGHGAGLVAPGMINENLCIHTKHPVELALAGRLEGAVGKFSQGEDAVFFQPSGSSVANAPEVGEGAVVPQLPSEFHLVQHRHPHSPLVGLRPLCQNVHGNLAQEEIGPNAHGGGDAGGLLNLLNDPAAQALGVGSVEGQVGGEVDEHLVYGIYVDVVGREVPEVDLVDVGGIGEVEGHAGWGGDVVQPFSCPCLYFPHCLQHLEHAAPPAEAVFFHGWSYCQADGVSAPLGICHHQAGGEGIQSPLDTLHTGIEAFEIDGCIDSFPVHLNISILYI